MPATAERSLVPELNLIDIRDDLIWGKDGAVTLVYAITPLHEPALDDSEVNDITDRAASAWSGLPEETSYQFHTLVNHRRAADRLEQDLPPIPDTGATSRLLEDLRRRRVKELTRIDCSGPTVSLIQERRHYLSATIHPKALANPGWAASLKRLLIPRRDRDYETIYDEAKKEAENFHRRVHRSLHQGLGLDRCRTPEIITFVHQLLNPSSCDIAPLDWLPGARRETFHESILEELPWLADNSPVWSLVDDDLLVQKKHLVVGDRFISIISLKALPERTEPAMMVPLIRMGREQFRLHYRLDVPRHAKELAALKAKSTLAEGLKLQNFLVKSEKKDIHAEAVSKQADAAMMSMIASGQKIFGLTLEITLIERSPDQLEEAVEEVLGIMARAHGLRGRRETYRLKPAWIAQLPGSPVLVEHRRKALTPVAVDLLPVFDVRTTAGKIPFLTTDNVVTFFDPFDAAVQMNANVLIVGMSGAGKSVAAQVVLSGYEVGAASQGDPMPHIFVLDNGASYQRYMTCREDGRYVAFSFREPPGCDVFALEGDHTDNNVLDEHVSRLEWLLLDLLKVDVSNEEEAERKKALIEQALFTIYRGGRERSFRGFASALKETSGWADFEARLYPYLEGKFARLFEPNPQLALSEDVHAMCYDFRHLSEHPDLAAIALRLVIYEIRRFAARMNRKRRRTFVVLDESWAMLDKSGGVSAVTAVAAPFLASSLRMGRKEGLSVIALSQQIDDFAQSAYGAAIIGNSATKLIGPPGREGLEGLRRHLSITERNAEHIRRLTRSARHQDFLLVQGDNSVVVRVSLDDLSRWLFTTSPADRDRLARLAEQHPELSELERVRLLANEEAVA